MKVLHFFIKDLGGDFETGKLFELASSLGELIPEAASTVYSDYFVASGLAPLRIRMSRQAGTIEDKPAHLTTYLKLFSYGVVLIEYVIELEEAGESPMFFNNARHFHLEKGKDIDLKAQWKTDLEALQPNLMKCVKKQYDPPTFIDRFQVFIDVKPRSEDEVMGILLPGDESYDVTKKRRIVKNINLWEEDEKFFIMGDRAYLYSELDPDQVINFIQLSRVQLYELMVYDYILDRGIENTYTFLDELPKEDLIMPLSWLGKSFRGQVRQVLNLTEMRMDLVDLIKDITNTTKVTRDPYFELLYRELNETFHVEEWFKSVENKISEIDSAQRMILSRIDIFKSTALEMTIIILIAIEIVLPPIKFLMAKFGIS